MCIYVHRVPGAFLCVYVYVAFQPLLLLCQAADNKYATCDDNGDGDVLCAR